MTEEPGCRQLHHVAFAVAPERRVMRATQIFHRARFRLRMPSSCTELGVHVRPGLGRRPRADQPDSRVDRSSRPAFVNEFLDSHGDGVYTVVLRVPGASAAEAVAERYGSKTRFRSELLRRRHLPRRNRPVGARPAADLPGDEHPMTVDTAKPSVFDAGLPTLSYDVTDTPQEIYPQFRAAQAIVRRADSTGTHWARSALVRARQDRAS